MYTGQRNSLFKSFGISGRGTFQIEGTPRARTYVKTLNQSGIAALQASERGGCASESIKLSATSIQFYFPNTLHITLR